MGPQSAELLLIKHAPSDTFLFNMKMFMLSQLEHALVKNQEEFNVKRRRRSTEHQT